MRTLASLTSSKVTRRAVELRHQTFPEITHETPNAITCLVDTKILKLYSNFNTSMLMERPRKCYLKILNPAGRGSSKMFHSVDIPTFTCTYRCVYNSDKVEFSNYNIGLPDRKMFNYCGRRVIRITSQSSSNLKRSKSIFIYFSSLTNRQLIRI